MKILRWLSQRTYSRLDALVILPIITVLVVYGRYWWVLGVIFVGGFISSIVDSITEGN